MKTLIGLVVLAVAAIVGLYFYGASIEPDTSIVEQEAENVRDE